VAIGVDDRADVVAFQLHRTRRTARSRVAQETCPGRDRLSLASSKPDTASTVNAQWRHRALRAGVEVTVRSSSNDAIGEEVDLVESAIRCTSLVDADGGATLERESFPGSATAPKAESPGVRDSLEIVIRCSSVRRAARHVGGQAHGRGRARGAPVASAHRDFPSANTDVLWGWKRDRRALSRTVFFDARVRLSNDVLIGTTSTLHRTRLRGTRRPTSRRNSPRRSLLSARADSVPAECPEQGCDDARRARSRASLGESGRSLLRCCGGDHAARSRANAPAPLPVACAARFLPADFYVGSGLA